MNSPTDNAESTDHVAGIIAAWQRERPDLDTAVPQGIIGRVTRLALALGERLEVVYEKFGLSDAEFDLLATLRRAGAPFERSAGELAAHTMVTTGGLTKRVDRLVERGFVERGTASDDARRRLVRLTASGHELIDRAFTAHIANEHRLIGQISAEDAATLAPILARWLTVLESE